MSSAVIAENYSAAKLKNISVLSNNLAPIYTFTKTSGCAVICAAVQQKEVVCSHCTLTGFRHYTEKQ